MKDIFVAFMRNVPCAVLSFPSFCQDTLILSLQRLNQQTHITISTNLPVIRTFPDIHFYYVLPRFLQIVNYGYPKGYT